MPIRAADEACFRRFVSSLEARHSSRSLLERARHVLPAFLGHIKRRRVLLRAVRETHVISFLVRLGKKEHLARSTQAGYLGMLRSFFGFLEGEGLVLLNPTANVAWRYPKQLPGPLLSEAQAARLLVVPSPWTACGKRDRALLELYYGTGVRLSEGLGLRLDDIDLSDNRQIFIRNGKGKVDRIVPLPKRAADALAIYLREARMAFMRDPGETAVFLAFSGRRLSPITFGFLLRRYGKQVGLPFNVRPHSLRHSYATHLLRHGANLREVQELLGHRHIDTTTRYTRVDTHDLARVLARSHPRGGRGRKLRTR